MENLVDNFRKSFEEAYDRGKNHGFECCFLQMKIHLGRYFIRKGRYQSANSMLEYILSLNSRDIKYSEQTKDELPSGYDSGLVQFEGEVSRTNYKEDN